MPHQPTTLKNFNSNYFSSKLTITISNTIIKINIIYYHLPLFLKEIDSIRIYQELAKEQTIGDFIFTNFIKNNKYYFQSLDFMDNKPIEDKSSLTRRNALAIFWKFWHKVGERSFI